MELRLRRGEREKVAALVRAQSGEARLYRRARMSRRVLRHGQFAGPDQLVRAIEAFVAVWNRREAHPFRWTYRGRPLVA